MAFLISHRGNLTDIEPELENTLQHISNALSKGFYVMIDIWAVSGGKLLATGNTCPTYAITPEFLKSNKVICKARDVPTLELLLDLGVHCFPEGLDNTILTSGGLIWTKPNSTRITTRCISTFPEHTHPDPTVHRNVICAGICSNYIQTIKDAIDNDTKIRQEQSTSNDARGTSNDARGTSSDARGTDTPTVTEQVIDYSDSF